MSAGGQVTGLVSTTRSSIQTSSGSFIALVRMGISGTRAHRWSGRTINRAELRFTVELRSVAVLVARSRSSVEKHYGWGLRLGHRAAG